MGWQLFVLQATGPVATAATVAEADIYLLSVFRDGDLQRRMVRAAGEVVVDEGPPPEVEAGTDWSDGEDALFAVAAALTGEPIGTHDRLTRPAVVHRRRAGG